MADLNAPITGEMLVSIVRRIERLHRDKREIEDDIKDIYAEAKSKGFDASVIRQLVKMRAKDTIERREAEAVLATYLAAIEIAKRNQAVSGGSVAFAACAPAHVGGREKLGDAA